MAKNDGACAADASTHNQMIHTKLPDGGCRTLMPVVAAVFFCLERRVFRPACCLVGPTLPRHGVPWFLYGSVSKGLCNVAEKSAPS